MQTFKKLPRIRPNKNEKNPKREIMTPPIISHEGIQKSRV
jgi:hypothetical protein